MCVEMILKKVLDINLLKKNRERAPIVKWKQQVEDLKTLKIKTLYQSKKCSERSFGPKGPLRSLYCQDSIIATLMLCCIVDVDKLLERSWDCGPNGSGNLKISGIVSRIWIFRYVLELTSR